MRTISFRHEPTDPPHSNRASTRIVLKSASKWPLSGLLNPQFAQKGSAIKVLRSNRHTPFPLFFHREAVKLCTTVENRARSGETVKL